MKEALKKLNKTQLVELSAHLMKWHEEKVQKVESKEYDEFIAFNVLTGNIMAIREHYNLPELKRK